MAAIAGELDVGERLARLTGDLAHHLQRLLVDDLQDVLGLRAHHRIDERIAAAGVAAQEEARAAGGDALHHLPGLHVDHGDLARLEVGARHHRARPGARTGGGVLPFPGDARAQVRHAVKRQIGDLLAHVEVHHLADPLARGPHQLGIVLGEEEVVEHLGEDGAARVEVTGNEAAFALCVVVDVADRDVLDRLGVADLPHLADVLERGDEGLARGGVVHRRHPRALLAVAVHRRDGLDQVQLAVEQHQRVGEVVGHRDVGAVGRCGDVAGVDAGTHLGHDLQVPQVELGDPAVARGEEHVAPVGGELGPAMQREARLEAVDRLEPVAVEHADVVVARLHHQEEVERVGVEHRLVGKGRGVDMDDARGADVLVGPARLGHHRGVDPLGERGDLVLAQLRGEAGHLGRGPALADHLGSLALAQAAQVVGQQRGPHRSEAIGRMAGRAMLRVERGYVDGSRRRRCPGRGPSDGLVRRSGGRQDDQCTGEREQAGQGRGADLHAETLSMRLQGVVTTRSAP